jgi:hypothetical protein
MFEFKCASCQEIHRGIPTFAAEYPDYLATLPKTQRENSVHLDSDHCVINNEFYFVRGSIEIPVHGYPDEPFIWGVWVSLSLKSYQEWVSCFNEEKRTHIGPFFGWLSVDLWPYPESCLNLKTRVHLRDNGIRPYIELEPTNHPLAVEQRQGITTERVAELYELMMHYPKKERKKHFHFIDHFKKFFKPVTKS